MCLLFPARGDDGCGAALTQPLVALAMLVVVLAALISYEALRLAQEPDHIRHRTHDASRP